MVSKLCEYMLNCDLMNSKGNEKDPEWSYCGS